MAKIFHVDFRKGSGTDMISNIQPTFTSAEILRTCRGSAANFNGVNSRVTFPTGTVGDIGTGDFSVTLQFRIKKTTVLTNTLFSKYIGSSDFYQFGIDGNGKLSFYIKVANATVALASTTEVFSPNIDYCVTIVVRRGVGVYFYSKGVLIPSSVSVPTSANIVFNAGVTIGSYSALYYPSYVYKIAIDNKALELKDIQYYYKEFLACSIRSKEKYPNVISKPIDLSRKRNSIISQDLFGDVDFSTGWSGTATIVNKNTFNTDTGTYIRKNSPSFIVGRRYIYEIGFTVTNAKDFRIYDYDIANIQGLNTSGNGSLREISQEFTCTTVSGVGIALWSTNIGSTVTIHYLRIREITGLITAYNMIPNGGVLTDISGNNNNGSVVGCGSNKNGLVLDGISDYINASLSLGTKYTVQCVFKVGSSGLRYLFGANSSSTQYFFFNGGLTINHRLTSGGTATVSAPYVINEKITLTISRDGTATEYIYVNGVKYTMTLASNEAWIMGKIGTRIIGNNDFDGEIYDFRAYNYAVTDLQAKQYHNSFINPSLVVDFSDEGADGISKVPSGLVKQSGAFKVGEFIAVKNEIFAGVPTVATNGWSVVGQQSIYTSNATTSLLGKAVAITTGKRYKISFNVIANPGGAQIRVSDAVTSYVADTAYAPGTWTFEFTSINATTAIYLRVPANNPSGLIVSDLKLQEIAPLPTLTNGTKYLECVTSGIILVPSKQAYGSWEFDWYKALDANSFSIALNANKQTNVNANIVLIGTNEAIYFDRYSNGAYAARNIATAIPYILINTWYRIKITRSIAGVFTLLIKGGGFSPTAGYDGWTLVSVAGGSGTNPVTDNTYTTSEYFVLDIDAGDRIANIKLTDGIKQI